MLVHICCSVDSHYFLQRVQEEFCDKQLIGFFYDPNIHPYSEYLLRLEDVRYSCSLLGIPLIEGEYDLENWLSLVKGLEEEPEKGERCTVCFDRRLDVSAKKAKELGCSSFTTSLLISPKKSQEKLAIIGQKLAQEYGLEFLFRDYRAKNGVELQGKAVKENHLYRQNYCGCLYALQAQREQQHKLSDELISPIGAQILPESIEERLELYKKRNELAPRGDQFWIIKQRFLNYRLLQGGVSVKKESIPSYFLAYSTLGNKKTTGTIEHIIDGIGYLNRDEVKVIDLKFFNQIAQMNYRSIFELLWSPPTFELELELRNKITDDPYDLSCIVVVESLPTDKIEITLWSEVFSDVREKIVTKK